MQIDEKVFNSLKKGFEYLEQYDRYGAKPDKRIVLSVTIPLWLKRKIENKKNISAFVEKAIIDELSNHNNSQIPVL